MAGKRGRSRGKRSNRHAHLVRLLRSASLGSAMTPSVGRDVFVRYIDGNDARDLTQFRQFGDGAKSLNLQRNGHDPPRPQICGDPLDAIVVRRIIEAHHFFRRPSSCRPRATRTMKGVRRAPGLWRSRTGYRRQASLAICPCHPRRTPANPTAAISSAGAVRG